MRDAASAREAVTELQNLVLQLHEELRSGRTETGRLREELRSGHAETQRLHEELRSGRTATVELQQALQLAEERADQVAAQVAELQRSRWRRTGLLLGLARKATFEK